MIHKHPTMPALLIAALCMGLGSSARAQQCDYPNNRAPLVQKPFVELPLGSVKARGWLLEMLNRQKTGATGQMDVLYPQVMGPRNGWLGGDGDQWERGPYWIDGLLPLAHILDDQALKDKVRPWVEWILGSQRADGFFGPARDYERDPTPHGLQRTNAEDWWPRMVALKILQQHHSATRDPRVVGFMTRYFQYQLKTLPEKPLGKWTSWARYRVSDNIQAVYWLYNMTGDTFLLELADLLYKQGHDYAEMYLKGEAISRIPTRDRAVHCVNIAQGIKGPVVYYQQHPDKKYLDAVRKGFSDIRKLHGHAHGLYGGDEELHGANPSQGSELCSAVEMMFSLETMLGMTGDTTFADHLERIAFNALPTQVTDDFMYKQYYQQANQVMATRHARNFNVEQEGTGIVFGLLSGYPCCVSNMHQGWPKFTRNLWFATLDNGLAALVYSPSEVSATVGGGCRVRITEDTSYPVDDKITFTIKIEDDARSEVTFPLHLRIPGWCKNAAITINGKPERAATAGEIAVVRRTWKSGDVLELSLPMEVAIDSWYENSMSVERGPLVYALRMTEQWTQKKFPPAETARFGDIYYEVTSTDKWNYGIIQFDAKDLARQFKVTIDPIKQKADYFWNPQNAPIQIKARAREIPHWRLYNEMTGPIPHSRGNPGSGNPGATGLPEVEITLIPYGCTTLRISQFPVVR